MDNPVAMVVPTLDEEKARAILRETWRSRKVWRDREWIGADLEIVVDEKQERFSRTVNRGLRNVLSVSWSQTWGEFDPVGYDYIGIMSDDCRPVTDGWLREMVDALEADEHLGFVSPAMPCRTVGMKEQTGPTAEREVREIFAVPYG